MGCLEEKQLELGSNARFALLFVLIDLRVWEGRESRRVCCALIVY